MIITLEPIAEAIYHSHNQDSQERKSHGWQTQKHQGAATQLLPKQVV